MNDKDTSRRSIVATPAHNLSEFDATQIIRSEIETITILVRDDLQCAVHSMKLRDSHLGSVHLTIGETLPLTLDLTTVQYLLASPEGVGSKVITFLIKSFSLIELFNFFNISLFETTTKLGSQSSIKYL